jgi:hypothetical protein
MVAAMIPEEMTKIRAHLGPAFGEGRYDDAAKIFAVSSTNDNLRRIPDATRVRPDQLRSK